MFAQFLIYVFLFLGFAWAVWKLIIIPVLKDRGIPYEEQRTEYTKKLEKLQDEYREMEASTQAAEEGVRLMADIKAMEAMILECDEKMEEMKK
jgi:hypothetical protein